MDYLAGIHQACWSSEAKTRGESFDIKKMLRDAAATGFGAVEVAGGREVLGRPEEFAERLSEHKLRLCAYCASVPAEPHEPGMRRFRQAAEEARAYGAPLIMVCGGFLANNRRNTYPADYDRFAKMLSEAIEFADGLNLPIAYHPHRGCIVETSEETQLMMDRIPELKLTVDVAHLQSSGDDPVAFIKRFGDRIIHTHIKDYDPETRLFEALGEGEVDLPGCFKALREANYAGAWCIELDGNPDRTAREAAELGRHYFKKHLDPA